MAVTHTNTEDSDRKVSVSSGVVASLAVSLPPHAAGVLLVVEAFAALNVAFVTTAWLAAGWSVAYNTEHPSGTFALLTKVAASGAESAPALTLTGAATAAMKAVVRKFTGFNSAAPINAVAVGEIGGGSDWNAPALTTTADGCMVFTGGGCLSASDFTTGDEPDGATLGYQDAANASWFGDAYFTQSSQGSIPAQLWTNSANAKTGFSFAIAPSSDSIAPDFTDGPDITNVTAAGFDVGGTVDESCEVSYLVVALGAAASSDADFDASVDKFNVTAATPFTDHHDGQ